MKADVSIQEPQRLQALHRYGILDTPRESDFDDVVALASKICDTPIAVINLIDSGRQWFKAEVGLGVRETPLDASICAHAILQPGIFEIPDTLKDRRFSDNPLCTGEPHLRFYTGALLETSDGMPIGTLCVLDHRPRQLDSLQRETLRVLSRQVMAQIELRWALSQADVLMREIDHRVKNSLGLVSGLLGLQSRRMQSAEARDALAIAQNRVGAVAELHDQLQKAASGAEVSSTEFFGQLVSGLQRTAPKNVSVETDLVPVALSGEHGLPLGLLVNEIVTNAFKHAFPDDRSGTIAVKLSETDDGLELSIVDDGVGISKNNRDSRPGLGMTLIDRLAAQLGGTTDLSGSDKGTRFNFRFPTRVNDTPSVGHHQTH